MIEDTGPEPRQGSPSFESSKILRTEGERKVRTNEGSPRAEIEDEPDVYTSEFERIIRNGGKISRDKYDKIIETKRTIEEFVAEGLHKLAKISIEKLEDTLRSVDIRTIAMMKGLEQTLSGGSEVKSRTKPKENRARLPAIHFDAWDGEADSFTT